MNKIVNQVRYATDNIHIVDVITRATHISQNKRYDQILKMFLENDPIEDFRGFLEIINSIRGELDAGEVRPHFVGCENVRYGHCSALEQYSGYQSMRQGFVMEHGVNFAIAKPSELNMLENFALIFQSNYKNELVHKTDKFKLTFCIGPYIHYTLPSYSNDTLKRMKEKLGKVALVYLSHSTHESVVYRKYEAYEEYAERLSDEFDTILFSVYWRDVNSDIYDTINNLPKAKIVSAGFLYDQSFIARTKSLISLADCVVVDEIGTSVGYALYMNKEVRYIENKDKRYMNTADPMMIACMNNQSRVAEALNSNNKERIQSVFQEFWGYEYIKTKKEIGAILEGLDEIRRKSEGKKSKFRESTLKMIDEWGAHKDSELKYMLFTKALENR